MGDSDPRPPQLVAGRPGDEGGRGLMILAALTSDWGARFDGNRKIVWCELLLG